MPCNKRSIYPIGFPFILVNLLERNTQKFRNFCLPETIKHTEFAQFSSDMKNDMMLDLAVDVTIGKICHWILLNFHVICLLIR